MLAKDPNLRPSAQEAARRLSQFAEEYADLPRLEGPPPEVDDDQDDHITTMLKGGTHYYVPSFHDSPPGVATHVPDVGQAEEKTMVRPIQVSKERPVTQVRTRKEARQAQEEQRSPYKKTIVIAAAIVGVVLIGAGAFAVIGSGAFTDQAEVVTERVSSNHTDRPLPTGLTTTREASFDPGTETITFEVTYSGQKSPLKGSFLEVVPGLNHDDPCPPITWEDPAVQPHKTSTTGLRAECGWRFDDVDIPVDHEVTFRGSYPATVADREELETWLTQTSKATHDALNDSEVTSTAYPVQRLQDIVVEVPERLVSQTPVDITLLPVWPNGIDELNPLMKSPVSGSESTMLSNIAGSFENVRFSDGCSGSVAVSSDGLNATALSVSTDCRIRAKVGNFTDLESNNFRITTRN